MYTENNGDNKGCLHQLTVEVFLSILAGVLLAAPCIICGKIILSYGD